MKNLILVQISLHHESNDQREEMPGCFTANTVVHDQSSGKCGQEQHVQFDELSLEIDHIRYRENNRFVERLRQKHRRFDNVHFNLF